jgi:hypothetical protein
MATVDGRQKLVTTLYRIDALAAVVHRSIMAALLGPTNFDWTLVC